MEYNFYTNMQTSRGQERLMLKTMKEKLEFYTVNEVAEILKLKKNTIYEAVRRGDLPAIRLNGRFSSYRIPASSLTEYTNKRDMPYKSLEAARRDLEQREAAVRVLEARWGTANV